MKPIEAYANDIYAGVLGKLIGVYLGRPVEGWSYEKIQKTFGQIHFYKNDATGAPLIVPDDDISGTFAFFRALRDNNYPSDITSRQIGETWLNYIVENQTILWWGGLSRSSEHTAFLRLKNGIPAPESGSIALNGRSMAEQVGAQIFIDCWALANPCDPEKAAYMARQAASVSHDGTAVEAAVYLAAMQAMAFEEKVVNRLLDEGLRFVSDDALKRLVQGIRQQCEKTNDWQKARDWIAQNHGYEKYPGNCPIQTNHLVVLMAILLAKDDFQQSVAIASSAGWDTDCNAGNVGAFNGIRLGLAGISSGADLRTPVADRLYLCTAEGGECITDAVIQTRELLAAASTLRGQHIALPATRFAFEYPGSVQGFTPYPGCGANQALFELDNPRGGGLCLHYRNLAKGVAAMASVDTFIDLQPKGAQGTSYFDVVASPSLYPTQTVKGIVHAEDGLVPQLRLFINYFDEQDQTRCLYSPYFTLAAGDNLVQWEIPDIGGHVIYRLGIALESQQRCDGMIALKSLDWKGAPRCYSLGKSMEITPSLTPWTTTTSWLKSFVSSAANFCPDYTTTFSISHPGENGVVTTGSRDWINYSVQSAITFARQKQAGLVIRANGHRRYYQASLIKGNAVISKRLDGQLLSLASVPFPIEEDSTHTLRFSAKGNILTFFIDGKQVARAKDQQFTKGGAGFVVEGGAILADGFRICAL